MNPYADLLEEDEVEVSSQDKNPASTHELERVKAELLESRTEAAELRREVDRLREENRALRRNASAIYHTAKQEMARRDLLAEERAMQKVKLQQMASSSSSS